LPIVLCAFASGAVAQQADLDAQLRRIFASRDFSGDRFGPARWLPGSEAYTTVERSATLRDASDIVRYDAAAGAREVLVPAGQLVPAGASEPLEIADYAWSADGTKLLVFTNSERVWRDHTRGDYWVLDRSAGTLKKLGGPDAQPSTLMFAKFSPDGTRVGYVREGDLYVENLPEGRITRLTNDASRTRVNGTTDWVYEEEFFLRDAFRWSPDGTRIAYWQFDMTGVRDFLLINNTDSLYSFTIPVQYPKAGTTNSAVRAGVVSANGGATTWLQLPGDPRNDYLPRMEWAANSRELVLQRMNRLQNTNRVLLADANTGALREVLVERDSTWLDVVNDLTWLSSGARFLWVSERDGWRHLYVVSRDGKQVKLITPGNYDVIDVLTVDEKGGYVYYYASPENPTTRYLYRARLSGGAPERLTPKDAKGWFSYQLSPNARRAFVTASSFDSVPTITLVDLPSHRTVRTLVANERLRANVAQVITKPGEFFRVKVGDGVELDAWMIKPRDFDASKKYPLLMYVYTEPWGQTATDAWGFSQRLWHQLLADQGYIVASVDNRGTPAPRGRAWRKIVYGSIGVLSSKEQAEAVRALAREHPNIDAARVGVWGWSGGGSATLNAMFRYPDVYQVGMAVAPVPDQRLYDTIYQERYTGLPQQNVEGYKAGSPISFAEGLRGDLLIVHGSGDDNVHYQGSERLVNRLIELNKKFDFMSYPNRSHCICEGEGTTLHIYSLLTRYLLEHLPAGGR
ncbi:MAG TPA: S9 family peptidase, partial [Longimicrobiales bacterium]|nr:S9 family peptidase [Longimicrobiales bacterium]